MRSWSGVIFGYVCAKQDTLASSPVASLKVLQIGQICCITRPGALGLDNSPLMRQASSKQDGDKAGPSKHHVEAVAVNI